MTEWEKLKVAELKEECKSRSIPLTGLKLKQQFIDKLVEYEANSQVATPAEDSQAQDEVDNVAERTHGAIEVGDKEIDPNAADPVAENGTNGAYEQSQEKTEESIVEDLPLAIETDQNLPSDRPPELKVEDSRVSNVKEGDDMPMARTRRESELIQKNDIMVPQPEQLDFQKNAAEEAGKSEEKQDEKAEVNGHDGAAQDVAMEEAQTKLEEDIEDSLPPETKIAAQNEPLVDIDQSELKKRKRRSASPPPHAEEVHKKAKSAQGEAIVTKTHSKSRSPSPQPDDKQHEKSPSPAASDLRSVEPSLHPPTRSLYLSNFKRPLHVPTLRSHIVTLAGSADPIEFFNINNIRSHAFVTFNSESAATRVRAKMHDQRFPDEELREKIFVDYIPDDKVQDWVEMETTSSRTGRNSNAKLEVAYIPDGDQHTAVFRDATQQNRNSRASVSMGASVPDRPAPRSPVQQRQPPPRQERTQPRDEGRGFEGLDELFESTKAKPKLYYKKVSQDTIDDRIDMIRDLYPDRGSSGDPGMKRYTFEKDGRREDWVDNGPEFGHGRIGQDRLLGVNMGGRGRGFGYRGRGRGFGGGYRGDFRR